MARSQALLKRRQRSTRLQYVVVLCSISTASKRGSDKWISPQVCLQAISADQVCAERDCHKADLHVSVLVAAKP